MFGYVRPFKPELLVRELTRYQSVYCGICKQIGRDYGQLPRLTLGYDLTMFAVVLLSLSKDQPPEDYAGCISNSLKKRPALRGGEILSLSAGLTILLAYHKAADNARDEHPYLGRSIQLALSRAYHKAARRYPDYEQVIQLHLGHLHELEKGPPDLAAADHFGRLLETFFIMAAPLAIDDLSIQAGLGRLGWHLGAWIYLLDAIDDYENDCNNGSWNPFSTMEQDVAQSRALELLTHHEEEMDRVAALLPYDRDAGLVGNIITMGLTAVRDTVLAGQRLGKF